MGCGGAQREHQRRAKMADDSPLLPLLVDQEVYPENLAQLGRNEAWLDTDLARRGMRRAEVLAYLGNKESCVVIQKKTAQNGRSENRKVQVVFE